MLYSPFSKNSQDIFPSPNTLFRFLSPFWGECPKDERGGEGARRVGEVRKGLGDKGLSCLFIKNCSLTELFLFTKNDNRCHNTVPNGAFFLALERQYYGRI